MGKRQHFVPQFCLRYFSPDSEQRTIGVFVLSSEAYIPSAPLRNQAYRKHFYGEDGFLEDTLAMFEGHSAELLRQIISTRTPPLFPSQDHTALVTFALFLKARTQYAADELDDLGDKLFKTVYGRDSRFRDHIDSIRFGSKNPAAFSVGMTAQTIHMGFDLRAKIIRNRTHTPFISSDNPVVYQNQFLEPRRRFGSNTGLATKGLQVFWPMTPELTLLLYDNSVYGIGQRSKHTVDVTSSDDVDALNSLQMLSAHRCLYFGATVSEAYLRGLTRKSRQFRRTRMSNISDFPRAASNPAMFVHPSSSDPQVPNESLLMMNRQDIRCDLTLSFSRVLKKAKSFRFDGSLPIRNEEILRLNRQFQKLVSEGQYRHGDFGRFLEDLSLGA